MPEWMNGLTWKVSMPDEGIAGSNPAGSADDEIAKQMAAVLIVLFEDKCLNRRGKKLLIKVAADLKCRKDNPMVGDGTTLEKWRA